MVESAALVATTEETKKEEVVEESKCALKEYEKRFPQDRKEQQ